MIEEAAVDIVEQLNLQDNLELDHQLQALLLVDHLFQDLE